jgi:type IV pilus assembly protein PilP
MRKGTKMAMRPFSFSACRFLSGLAALVLFTAVLFSLTACDSEFKIESLPKVDSKSTTDTAAQADTQAAPAPVEKDYVYTSIGKRDPFRSVFDDAGGADVVTQTDTILGPLQSYDVNSFKVMGIVWGISSPSAMVQDPTGKTHVVKTGTLIGRNWGRVIKIKRDSIVILEQSPLPNGTKVSNIVEIKLPSKTIKPMENEIDLDKVTGEENPEDTQGIDGL